VNDFSAIQQCRQITDDHIHAALESRAGARALFERAVAIAKPRDAGARLLLLFAKMVAADWLDGALRVDMIADGDGTTIESLVDIGAGLKERVFAKTRIHVPLEEFLAAIKKFPGAIAPLTVESSSAHRLILVAPEVEKPLDDDDEDEPAKPAAKPLSAADLPAIGAKRAKSHPPPGTLHRPAQVSSASSKPPAKKPLAKLNLRKTALFPARGAAEEVGPAKEFNDASVGTKRAGRAPPPFVANPKPAEPAAEPSKDDVDKEWGE
jgi:hypothetical protein